MDNLSFRLLSEKLFVEICKTAFESGNSAKTFAPDALAAIACSCAKSYLERRDIVLREYAKEED